MVRPTVSVVVPSFNAAATIERCLSALGAQECDEPFEIVVIDSSTDGTADVVRRRFPRVVLHTFPERKFPGEARNEGAARSTGEILAFTDADCVPDRWWVREIVDAHRRGGPVIGGTIDNANPDSRVGWAHFFCDLTPWMPGTSAGPMDQIPTGNLSVRRWALERYGPFADRTYSSDTAFSWRAAAGGHPPLFVPAIRVAHVNVTDLAGFLRRSAVRGRGFARVRAGERRFSPARRAVHVALSPGLPVLLGWRAVRNVLRRRRYRRELALSLPLVLLGLIAWSWGELRGYLEGGLDRSRSPAST
ncbi:MAG TPA: glycosyltransferase [Gemmatimonadota bacterium]|jgi:glycosyltransferase involved in cell wall biosynthesis